ncbi:hypothetical protein [Mycobacteroides abscessus]|uniref:hypothetical protein n=1 Tax=Mycobacteroides abscessus TaxID=36809 RepID=UPI0005E87D90|nr:hypothetical protein [Mycobacteroides abscessus]CPW66935.1 Uncharacterised protein [Mycobacteroides abscessus]SKF61960.1 Uncharacterised protein [Mycobacteroides abscessus subsp. bolletii]SKH89435.1 Uncharacterised protein [Mycobacteroides abscessus subsp. bolletii]
MWGTSADEHPLSDDDYFTRLDKLPTHDGWPQIRPWVDEMWKEVRSIPVSEGREPEVAAFARHLYRIPSRDQQRAIIVGELGKEPYRKLAIGVLVQAYRDFADARDMGGTPMRWYIADAIDGPLNEKQIENIFGLIAELSDKTEAMSLLSAVARTKKQRERAVLLIKEVLETPLGSKEAVEVIPPAAVAAAGRLRDPRLYEPLKALADTPDKWLRDRVKRALAQCEPKQENTT